MQRSTVLVIILLVCMLVGCTEATPTIRPTSTPRIPEYTIAEVIGIVHNNMVRECHPKSPLVREAGNYSAIPHYEQPNPFQSVGATSRPRPSFLGHWTVRWRYGSGDSSYLEWEFYEDSGIVTQRSARLGGFCR